jgi:hypothetical protein
MAANNVDELSALGAVVKTASSRLKTINESNDKKYSASSSKMDLLHKEIQFELGKMINNIRTTAKESRTIFESLIIGIGNRYLSKMTNESGNQEVEGLPKEFIINEALTYITALETFHTLRILDVKDLKENRKFRDFVNAIKE